MPNDPAEIAEETWFCDRGDFWGTWKQLADNGMTVLDAVRQDTRKLIADYAAPKEGHNNG